MSRRSQRGFSYVGLLLSVALLGAGLAAAGSVWRVQLQREREADLLYAGAQIRQAIRQYYEGVPLGQPHRFPQRLEDLLLDRRWPTVRRHLRRLYLDPMTGSTDWALLRAPDGGILGVHSRSGAAPLKRQGFGRLDTDFEDAAALSDWRFVYRLYDEDDASATQPAPAGALPTVPLSALPQFRTGGASNAR
ncbi:MAG TPA: type II secretion system protein [Pseudorhodoferax sp.]|nr:type II secretion system protein [Pseudorhodoferax sp.]